MPYYRGRTSELWNHLLALLPVEGNRAKCGCCSVNLSNEGGNLSNLKRHLTAKHPTVSIYCKESNQQRGI